MIGKSTLLLEDGNRGSGNPQPSQTFCHRLSLLIHVDIAIYIALLISPNEYVFCYPTVTYEISERKVVLFLFYIWGN